MLIFGILLLLAFTTSVSTTCTSDDFYNYAYQVPKHDCPCNVKTTGILRYHNNQIQFCNGQKYVDMGAGGGGGHTSKIGSKDNPGKSCRDILYVNGKAKSGLYYIKAGKEVTKTYCFMGEICGSRGWSMIMKIDGAKNTFHYDSKKWTDKHPYNEAAAAGGLDNQETKLATYYNFPFSKLCLGLKTSGITNWLRLNYEAQSLYSVIHDGKYRVTNLERNAWKALVPGSSLQKNCNKEGFNVKGDWATAAKARIGITANGENDCASTDSRLGFGTAGSLCGQNDKHSAGNEARCGPDNGDKSIVSIGYIFAQERLEGSPLGSYDNPASSCSAIKAAIRSSKNGVYYLKLGERIVSTFCLMDEVCGSRGWTMIMKVDGNKRTFHYDSAYWTNKATYNVKGASGGLDNQETKLGTYSDLPFNALCVGMKTGDITRWLKVPQKASSLYSLIADNTYRATRLGRDAWEGVVPGSSLQVNCNKEGFNVKGDWAAGGKARIGIIGNQENQCISPDSRLGVGTAGSLCGQNDNHSAGNEARCTPEHGDKSTASLGFVFAQ